MGDIRWTVAPSSPVIRPGQLHGDADARLTAPGQVIRVGDRYRMYYWGSSPAGENHIFIAESPVDQLNEWVGLGPVLGAQPDCPYNAKGPVIPMVLPRDDGPWLLYCGTNAAREPGTPFWWYTAAAMSDDEGLTWRYVTTQPLIKPGNRCDAIGTGTVFVLRENDLYRMYYTACSALRDTPARKNAPITGLGYAESADGLTWTRPSEDFLIPPRFDQVLPTAAGPYEDWIAKPFVIEDTDAAGQPMYRMWVSGKTPTYRVHQLISEDGLNWRYIDADRVHGDLGVGAPGSFDGVQRSYATVIREDQTYHMWYAGNGFGGEGMGYAVGVRTNEKL